ncbi:hypothetical protein IJM86_04130 [bacterium]|nr:hypothetical protein [bacterium]
MVKWATDSFDFLKNDYKLQFIFVVLKEHVEQYKIDEYIKSVYDNPIVIALD